MSSEIPRKVNIYRWIGRALGRSKLLQPPNGVTVLLEHLEDRVLAGQMPCADCNHDRAGLRHALLDPSAPIGVALSDQGLAEGRGPGEIAVEGLRDSGDVAARPCAQHSRPLGTHAIALLD